MASPTAGEDTQMGIESTPITNTRSVNPRRIVGGLAAVLGVVCLIAVLHHDTAMTPSASTKLTATPTKLMNWDLGYGITFHTNADEQIAQAAAQGQAAVDAAKARAEAQAAEAARAASAAATAQSARLEAAAAAAHQSATDQYDDAKQQAQQHYSDAQDHIDAATATRRRRSPESGYGATRRRRRSD